jgi:hypothetical protein
MRIGINYTYINCARGNDMIIDTDDWISAVDAAKLLGIKYRTLTAYIMRDQVVPKEKVLRVWGALVIRKDWVEERVAAQKENKVK